MDIKWGWPLVITLLVGYFLGVWFPGPGAQVRMKLGV
jgi:hypothetical protein